MRALGIAYHERRNGWCSNCDDLFFVMFRFNFSFGFRKLSRWESILSLQKRRRDISLE